MESDTARVSALPVVRNEVPAVYFGKVTLDSVGVRVGPSCLRLDDPEDTPPALLDERGVMTDVHLGGFPRVSCSPVEMCAVDSNFPRVRCSPVEMCAVDSNFPRSSFPPGKLCAEQLDYIKRASRTGLPVFTRTVTGSLLFGSPHKLVRGYSCSTLFLHRWTDELEVFPVDGRWTWGRVQSVHAYLLVTFDCFFFSSGLIAGTVILMTGILFARDRLVLCRHRQCLTYSGSLVFVFLCCLVVAGFKSTDVSAAMEQAGPSSASSARLHERFYAFR